MNALFVNKYHYYRAGPDIATLNTAALLEQHEHKVLFFSMSHPESVPCETSSFFVPYLDLTEKQTLLNQVKIAGRILYSVTARNNISELLNSYPVDIAHLHDICHHISPSILHDFKKRKIPVVMTLHDLKMVCTAYHMYADGTICEDCSNGRYYKAVRKRCVKDSLAKSMLGSLEMYLHHVILHIYNNVDVFIAPSLFLKNKLIEAGFKKRIIHLPNFINLKDTADGAYVGSLKDNENNTISYIGRLSQEKGIKTLLSAAKLLLLNGEKVNINILGDGPMRNELESIIRNEQISNVRLLGYMKHDRLYQEIKKSLAIVLPSECYENNPLSVLEAFAFKKPVIGSRRGGIPELVKDYETGLTFEPGSYEDLSAKIKFFIDNPDKAGIMGEKARAFVAKELNPEKHYQGLMEIYMSALELRRSKRVHSREFC